MTRFEKANERLLSALDRLERAAERSTDKPIASGEDSADGEVAELREALEASRRANAALRSSRDEVSARLDGAIDRLTQVLGD